MFGENVTHNLTWIDDAFSKEYVDILEAACCLTAGQNKVYFAYKEDGYFIDQQIHPILRTNYRVITTWRLRGDSLLRFIDKAISKNLQNFRRELLLSKCKEIFFNMSPADQKQFISDNYYISRELNLMVSNDNANDVNQLAHFDQKQFPSNNYFLPPGLGLDNDGANNSNQSPETESLDEDEYLWVPYAKRIYSELELDKSPLNMEKRAKKVQKEMKIRFDAGDKNMAKRGGKEVPSTSTILRHALQNLE
ncbi:MAG TPA: hypothetical protein VLI69_03880 [Gammaproteobacteria bacterium]|nr:hypothetical protein [Gammaproteobacteria bacterium]